MKINDILDCYNKALDMKGNPEGVHYVTYSNWEKIIGACIKATTIISIIGPDNKASEVVKAESISNTLPGQEDKLIEESQLKALMSFIIYYDSRIK